MDIKKRLRKLYKRKFVYIQPKYNWENLVDKGLKVIVKAKRARKDTNNKVVRSRALTIRNLYDQQFDYMPLSERWRPLLGDKEMKGVWLVYGREKHGKTTVALTLANDFSEFAKILYVSAEEGKDSEFVEAMQRVKLEVDNRKIHFTEYIPTEEISSRLKKRNSPDIAIIDNLTIYQDELGKRELLKFLEKNENKLLIFLAHEGDDKKPYTAAAKLISKLAKVIFHVEGLACFITGRCPGGRLDINEEKAALYHGEILNN